jgi:hypothetical protein
MSIYGSYLRESTNIFQEADENYVVEECIFVNENSGVSSQGKQIKQKIKEIMKENTTKLGVSDTIKRYLFGGTNAIDASKVDKILKGISNLFDCCFNSQLFTYTNPATNDKSTHINYIAIKGEYLYTFAIKFNVLSSNIVSFSFNEKKLSSFDIPKEAIKFAITNCKGDFLLQIGKKYIASYSISRGKYQPNLQNSDLYNKILSKFKDKCNKNDNMGYIEF